MNLLGRHKRFIIRLQEEREGDLEDALHHALDLAMTRHPEGNLLLRADGKNMPPPCRAVDDPDSEFGGPKPYCSAVDDDEEGDAS